MTLRVWGALVIGALCVFLGSWSALHHGTLGRGQIVDTNVYVKYAHAVVDGKVPYRDFTLEYPPGALPAFVLPGLVDDVRPAYDRWFDREMALCGCLMLIGCALCLRSLGAGLRRTAAALGLVAVSPLLIGSLVLTRFDFWPAALAVLALAALLWERRSTAAVLLGCAIGAKLWPAAILPVAVVWILHSFGRRAAAVFTAIVAAVIAAIFIPFAVLGPDGLGHSFHQQLARPMQIESLGASILIAFRHLIHQYLVETFGFGSQNVAGTGVHAVEIATTVVGIAGLLAVWVLFARSPMTPERLVTAVAASVAMLLAFGKVFSPQFVIWLVPFVVLVPGRRGLAASLLAAGAFALTHAWFPHHYWELANGFQTLQSGELLLRNLCVVSIALLLAWPAPLPEPVTQARRERSARQPPAPRARAS
jgi:hypothetical protein